MAEIELEPLAADNLAAFADLLGGRDFGGCFCAVWTAYGDDWGARCADPARPNLTVTEARVAAGRHVGFLVRRRGGVVGWTGSGPKSAYPLLADRLGARLSPLDDHIWFVGCLAVPAARRGAGLAASIVRAVVERARASGVRAVEAAPTRPWDEPRSYRGSLRLYERLGFREVGAEPDGATEIVLVRLDLA